MKITMSTSHIARTLNSRNSNNQLTLITTSEAPAALDENPRIKEQKGCFNYKYHILSHWAVMA